jgi:hypothetical protein
VGSLLVFSQAASCPYWKVFKMHEELLGWFKLAILSAIFLFLIEKITYNRVRDLVGIGVKIKEKY